MPRRLSRWDDIVGTAMVEKCRLCGERHPLISSFLGLCPACARKPESKAIASEAHARSLESFGLKAPSGSGTRCGQCVNDCAMGEGERGLCGLRVNRSGRIVPVQQDGALVDWYYDPLPTNCVAQWVCSAEASWYPSWKKNLAVFFYGCTFDCLFCQNWPHKEVQSSRAPLRPVERLVRGVDTDTYCVCFFGGDPTPQLQFALRACDMWLARPEMTPKICWETNGSMSPALADRVADVSIRTGGTVKFDLKAFDENLHYSLCGVSNRRTLENFRRLSRRGAEAEGVFLVASTLLVPGYIDAGEVKAIAEFIAAFDPSIPYSLLAFHPDYLMADLPMTSLKDAEEAMTAAKGAGLQNVHIGNVHVLA